MHGEVKHRVGNQLLSNFSNRNTVRVVWDLGGVLLWSTPTADTEHMKTSLFVSNTHVFKKNHNESSYQDDGNYVFEVVKKKKGLDRQSGLI